MEYINVKGIETPISRIIMGTAWFTDIKFKAEVFKMLDLYLEVGGNVLDTGLFYGNGLSETILKEYFLERNNREKFVLIDKACHPIITPDGSHHPEYWRVKPDLITDDLYHSLFKLGVDHIDIYLLHRDDEKVPVGDIMDRLEQHRKDGLISAYGVSNWEITRVQEAMEYCDKKGYQGLSVNNPSYSLATVKETRWPGTVYINQEEAEWHAGKEITLFSWASQAHGFFADIYDEHAPQDIKNAFFTEENFKKLERTKLLGKELNVEPINIALSYILNQPFDTAAIVGTRNRKEFLSSVKTLEVKLSEEQIEYLKLKSNTFA